jgi:hypothetical protein
MNTFGVADMRYLSWKSIPSLKETTGNVGGGRSEEINEREQQRHSYSEENLR